MTQKIKYPYMDIGELVMVLGHPMLSIRFVKQEFDKRQWWLEISDGLNVYYTSINKTKWDRMGFETKAEIVKIAKRFLSESRTGGKY